MIDTHCHLNAAAFDLDREAVLARGRRAGVVQWVIPGVVLADFSELILMASPELLIALGLHPVYLDAHPVDALEQLEQWVMRSHPVAIGEIGLDYLLPPATHEGQMVLLEGQLQLAKRYHLPVLLHVRRAHDLVCGLLRRLAFTQGGIVHAFNGSLEQAHRYLDLGFRLGFGGVMTYPRAVRIRKVATLLPVDALVLETDAPDLTPVGHAKQRNEPAYLLEVVQTLAELRGVSVASLIEATTDNARMVLGIKSENL